jgi:PAS domain S-box-containing protein
LGTALEELQVAEEELRTQNEELLAVQAQADAERHRYQDLFGFAPNGYVVTDAEGVIQEANRAAAELLGAEPRFLAGKPLVLFVESPDRPRLHDELSRLLRGLSVRPLVVRVAPRSGGGPRTVALAVGAVRDPDRRRPVLRWQMVDVTEQRRAEAEARDLNAELEQRVAARTAALEDALSREQAAQFRAEESEKQLREADRRKNEFLAMLGHELRNPLAPLRTAIRLLAEPGWTGRHRPTPGRR